MFWKITDSNGIYSVAVISREFTTGKSVLFLQRGDGFRTSFEMTEGRLNSNTAMKEKAFFVFRPRSVEELTFENPNGKMREYRIVKSICLSQIDHQNFATDLLADRQFIEDNAALCVEQGDCLLVTNRRRELELLIIPWRGCFVKYAALRPTITLLT